MSPLAVDDVLRRPLDADGKTATGQRTGRTRDMTLTAGEKGVEPPGSGGLSHDDPQAKAGPGAFEPLDDRSDDETAQGSKMRLGRPVRHFDRLDSTNREAERWALAGAPEGALVVAQHQLAGRGRLGRSWFDLPGKSLLFSMVLRPPLPASATPAITFVAAVALADALSRWVPRERIEIKWPNDVLVGRRKGAGILLEMRCEAQRVEHVILGVGVNVAGDPGDFPDEIRDSCTAVAAWSAAAPNPSGVLQAFLEEFEARYEAFLAGGLATIVPRWNRWFRGVGRRFRVGTPSGVLEGTARGLGPSGALVLDLGGERIVQVHAGDVESCTTQGT